MQEMELNDLMQIFQLKLNLKSHIVLSYSI